MKLKYGLLSLAILPCLSFAECNQNDQVQIHQCMTQQLKTDKVKMNKLYQQAYNKFENNNQILLEKSQKAWLNYRNVQCDELMGSLTYGASGMAAGLVYLQCQLDSTEFRLKELQDLAR